MRYAFALLALMASGCEVLAISTGCTTFVAPAIVIVVADAASGRAVQTDYVVVTAIDGSYRDSKSMSAMTLEDRASLALEREGNYRIEIAAKGYEDWSRNGVQVRLTADGCHVETVHILAQLQRSPVQ